MIEMHFSSIGKFFKSFNDTQSPILDNLETVHIYLSDESSRLNEWFIKE